MTLKENTVYWKISLGNPERIIDSYYVDDYIIVNDQDLIGNIELLRDMIHAYCLLLKFDELLDSEQARIKLLYQMLQILEKEKTQYTEFVAFWKTLDFTYSVFMNMKNDQELRHARLKILEEILHQYCQKRVRLYSRMGYTNVTVQALYDSSVSRKKGTKGALKLEKIIKEISASEQIVIEELHDIKSAKKPCWYFVVDRNEALFNGLIKEYNIKYDFGHRHQGKLPDLVLKLGMHLLIIEAKHIKETGGAQSKQINELIEFIKQVERAQPDCIIVHYVAFLDGVYFNLLINPQPNSQVEKQKNDIKSALEEYRQNYFVNTEGFKTLIGDLILELKLHGSELSCS